MIEVSNTQYNLVYNVISFTLASMAATTIFVWMRVGSIAERYKSALIITGIVTFIATYHYFRIFNSWVEAYEWTPEGELSLTGVPFNDAYRYMDWLLTVPLLLIEIILVMKLDADEARSKCITLGSAAALMIILGYPGETVLDSPGNRWFWWTLSMIPFLYIVYTLMVGLAAATASESDPRVRGLVRFAKVATVVSWCTYPIVYIFPMLGITGSTAAVAVQIGYSIADIIAKCGVGLLVYSITVAKSDAIKSGNGEETPLTYGSRA